MSAISCQQHQFGTLDTGQKVTAYSLRNTSGMTVNLLNYGAILNAIQVPDLRGQMHEITLGPSQLADLNDPVLSGATVINLPNRYGIKLDILNQTLWEAESITQDTTASVRLSCHGALDLKYSMSKLEYQCTTEYTLTSINELTIHSEIKTSLPLPISMTHHLLWNLTGEAKGDISDHILQIWASHYAEIDKIGFANSEYLDIFNHPAFDFRQPQRIGEKHIQISQETPYDIYFKLAEQAATADVSPIIPLASRVKAPISGRILEVYTTQPGLRFYLKSNEQNTLTGFCLSPMPLLNSEAPMTSNTDIARQETRYKLIW